jgi:hypothetical protein
MIEWVSKLTRKVVKFVVRVEEQALAPVEVHYYSLPSVLWRHAPQSKLLIVISYNRIMVLVGT